MEPTAFKHNFDKHKYIVVIFARNVVKLMWSQTNATNVRHTYTASLLSYIKMHNAITDNCKKIRPEY